MRVKKEKSEKAIKEKNLNTEKMSTDPAFKLRKIAVERKSENRGKTFHKRELQEKKLPVTNNNFNREIMRPTKYRA